MKYTCQLCNMIKDTHAALIYHITEHVKKKDISSKEEYYRRYINPNPKCLICGGSVEFHKQQFRFQETCSKECRKIISIRKRDETCLKLYGVKNPIQLEDVKRKNVESNKKTCMDRYGVEYASQLDSTKKKMVESLRKTSKEKYGVDWVASLEDVKKKREETSLQRHGTKFPIQLEKFKEKRENNMLKKYGVDYALRSEFFKEKSRQSCLEKYGVENPSQVQEFKDKKTQTMIKLYGVKHYSSHPEFLEKFKQTCLERYGVSHFNKTEKCKNQIRLTCLTKYGTDTTLKMPESIIKAKTSMIERYGVDNYVKTDEFKNLIKFKRRQKYHQQFKNYCEQHDYQPLFSDDYYYDPINTTFKFLCKACDGEFEISSISSRIIPACETCKKVYASEMERNFIEWLKSVYDKEIIINSRSIITPYQLDVYLPDAKLAIELDGIYWHNENVIPSGYHLMKSERCLELGIDLIHVFEDEYLKRYDKLKHLIKEKLNILDESINKDDVTIKMISNHEAYEFINHNHIELTDKYLKFSFGAYQNEHLVSVMSFIQYKGVLELYRFCSSINIKIEGVHAKILSFANSYLRDKGYDMILAYANRRHHAKPDNIYNNELGFEFSHIENPRFFYYYQDKLWNKEAFQRDRLIKMLLGKYDESVLNQKTESELINLIGLLKLYDCGYYVYKLQLNK